MLYKNDEELKREVFENPGPEYRGTPFWAWNTKMTKEKVKFMTEVLKDMGMGGAHLHSRIGMNNVYLSEEFMDLIKTAHEEFKKKGMLTWLYDEDKWPSGYAGGYVTKDHRFRERFLVFSVNEDQDKERAGIKPHYGSWATPIRGDRSKFLAKYEIRLNNGYLSSYRRLRKDEEAAPGTIVRYAFSEVCGDNPWFNNRSYVNVLDKSAIDEFIRITHEKYYAELGEDFGKDIPAIFSDEPQFPSKERLGYADDDRTVTLPYSNDFEEDFERRYGCSLLDHLPEIFWELNDGKYSEIRYKFHDFVCERFVEAFADNIGDWCRKHSILFTGHMMEEPWLQSQTAVLGEAMRSYRGFDIPGIDMLCDRREFTTAKQAESAAHQIGAPGVMSELYGVTGYNFDFRGHKLQGDWQAALGVTVRVPHLTWTSMAGEAKRDYPASIGYQSPWYKEYKYIEDYFGRLNTVLTRGKAEVRVAVIHPIESFWLLWGTEEQTGELRRQKDEEFKNITEWLLLGLMDFDFISEALLKDFENGIEDGKFKCGKMRYDAVVVPNLITIRSNTLKLLKEFASAGGLVVVAGDMPSYVDGKEDTAGETECDRFVKVGFDRYSILSALKDMRIVDIRDERGIPVTDLVYQMRKEEDCSWLFVAHAFRNEPVDIPRMEHRTIEIKGMYMPMLYDALTGEIRKAEFRTENGKTFIKKDIYAQDSLLFKLIPTDEETSFSEEKTEGWHKRVLHPTCSYPIEYDVPETVHAETEEPNVLILDMAEYNVGGKDYGKEEILRIDNKLRVRAGGTVRMHAYPQPWAMDPHFEYARDLTLRYTFESEICGLPLALAIEKPEEYEIIFNGKTVDKIDEGFYVDKDISKIALGILKKGVNEIILKTVSDKTKDLEAIYVLGDFGVRLKGSVPVITDKPTEIGFDDITRQDLPFYSGNLDYSWDFELREEEENGCYDLVLSVTHFRCPLIAVELDGKRAGTIAFAPYECTIKNVAPGKHTIKLIAFGNRNNTFGPLHLADSVNKNQDPDSWRTEGSRWCYEYRVAPFGILKRPELRVIVKNN